VPDCPNDGSGSINDIFSCENYFRVAPQTLDFSGEIYDFRYVPGAATTLRVHVSGTFASTSAKDIANDLMLSQIQLHAARIRASLSTIWKRWGAQFMLKAPRPASKKYLGKFSDAGRWDAFMPRVGDIVVATPPKSGTTWTQSILALLISGDPEIDAETSMKSPWIDFNVRELSEVMARLEAQDHRRQVKTHNPLDGIPLWPDLRYITVYRHPIDVYFSFRKHAWNQNEAISREFFPDEYFSEDPSDGFRVFLEGDYVEAASLKSIVDHYRCTLDQEPSENIIRLHYADMLRDLSGTFEKIAVHTGIATPPDVMVKLVEAATFDNMKANAHRFAPSAGQGNWKNDAEFFHSASSNKWVGKLSEVELSAYDARMSDLATPEERCWLEFGSVAGE